MKFDYKNSGTIKLFVQHYKGHLGLFSLDMACALAVSAIDLLFPYFSKKSMEMFLPNYMFKTFFTVMAIFIAAYLLKAVLYYIITYWGHRMGTFIEADLRDELFGHIEKLSFSFFDKNRTGQLMSRVTNDLFEITPWSGGSVYFLRDDHRRILYSLHDRMAARADRFCCHSMLCYLLCDFKKEDGRKKHTGQGAHFRDQCIDRIRLLRHPHSKSVCK